MPYSALREFPETFPPQDEVLIWLKPRLARD